MLFCVIHCQRVGKANDSSPKHLLPALPNKTSERLQSNFAQIRADRPRYLHLQIIRQQMDVLLEKELLTFLVEDQTVDNKSYVDFICLIHKYVS